MLPDVLLKNLKVPDALEYKIKKITKEVTVNTTNNHKMRADFVLDMARNNKKDSDYQIVVEVKNVVCADYAVETAPLRKGCVYTSDEIPYYRTAIFPWGNVKQMYNGEK